MKLEILVVGLNHSTAPVEIREKITFPGDQDGRVTRLIADVPVVEEAMILSTCNRSEVIVMTEHPENAAEDVIEAVGRIHDLDPKTFSDFLYVRQGIDAVNHVFRVASSLDSMVVGEPQILGQVKEGYRRAADANATGPILNRLMHRAFFTAKRVRTETGVGLSAVSVAYVAVELARKILGDLKDKTVLLIGAGEMAELAARHLRTHAEKPIIVVNRTYENACTLAGQLRGRAVPIEQLDDGLVGADVVITSTGSCESLIKAPQLKDVMRRRRFRPIFLIDIAIPRDVQPESNEIDGVYLYNIDDLQTVVHENVGERRQEAIRGESIVEEEAQKFVEWTRTLESAPTIIALKKKLEGIREAELARLNGKLSTLSPAEREIVEIITRSIINKIAHDPIAFLKKAGSRSKRNVYLDVAQRLFGLDGLASPAGPEKEETKQE
ncbi:MAG: glutamyl-tRNA reductase [Desulfomonile tiedjei]|nr:glutamyl-tRNA reductase [Desulfomonile tiedjei]